MKKNEYLIRGEKFSTKAALETRIRGIRDSYVDCEPLSIGDFEFMLEVLEGHPQYEAKRGVGIDSMYVKTNNLYRSNRCFYLVRVDGTETDFSFGECLSPTSHAKKVERALRAAVEPHTIAFKRKFFDNLSEPYYCPYTGERLNFVGSHVDHIAPNTFHSLMTNFIKEYGIDVEKVEVAGDYEDNVYQNTLVEEQLKHTWIAYHNAHACLQIVSRKANLSFLKRGDE